jgi:hypothetical protein
MALPGDLEILAQADEQAWSESRQQDLLYSG